MEQIATPTLKKARPQLSRSLENMPALHYEYMLRRAYGCARGERRGVDAGFFLALEQEERNLARKPYDSKTRRKFERRLSDIKTFMQKGLEQASRRLRRRGDPQENITRVLAHIPAILKATKKDELIIASRAVLDTFIDLNLQMH